jgi:hypothetical protein
LSKPLLLIARSPIGMRILTAAALAVALFLAPAIVSTTVAVAQDPSAPCGIDRDGTPLQCARPDPRANLESACLTTGRVENCVAYHRNACQISGFQQACRLYALGQNCFGGDQNTCAYYVSLLRANTACALDRDQSACAWLQQQRY